MPIICETVQPWKYILLAYFVPGTGFKCARVSEGLSAITTAKPLGLRISYFFHEDVGKHTHRDASQCDCWFGVSILLDN